MALVLGVIKDSIFDTSRFGWLDDESANTIFAPRKTNAFAVDTKVYEGMITSSPSSVLISMAAISKASVQEVVNKHF